MKKSIKNFGSFQNWLMSNNETMPEVDQPVTIMSYSDRDVAIVREVSDDGQRCIIEQCHTKAKYKNSQMGHQDWEHTPNGQYDKLRYYRGNWKREYEVVEFSKSFELVVEQYNKENGTRYYNISYLERFRPDVYELIRGYQHKYQTWDLPEMMGFTERKTKYDAINVLFGVSNYHYDWSF